MVYLPKPKFRKLSREESFRYVLGNKVIEELKSKEENFSHLLLVRDAEKELNKVYRVNEITGQPYGEPLVVAPNQVH